MEPSSIDVQRALNAIGEPTRFRIVALLAVRAHAVGELAEALATLQPQTTKHVHALESAGVVTVHRLGRRRVVRLNRRTMALLEDHFGGLAHADPDDAVLDDYERAIGRVDAHSMSSPLILRFERMFAASAEDLWAAWTQPGLAARWWAPRHFTVTTFELSPRPGAAIRVALREGDATTYESAGEVLEVGTGRLVFSLAPLDASREPLFHARHTLTITGGRPATMTLEIEVTDVRSDAAPAVAGLEPGWVQLLDNLTETVS